MNVKINKT